MRGLTVPGLPQEIERAIPTMLPEFVVITTVLFTPSDSTWRVFFFDPRLGPMHPRILRFTYMAVDPDNLEDDDDD
jgi:hypothetical protein